MQLAANGLIGYLQGVLDQGSFDKKALQDWIDRFHNESHTFREWANLKLAVVGAVKGEGEKSLLKDVLDLLNEQELARRKAVKETLDKYQFRSWDVIPKGQEPTGALTK